MIEGAIVDIEPIRERCAARRDIGESGFTAVGEGGLSPGPDSILFSPYASGSSAVARESTSVPPEPSRTAGHWPLAATLGIACGSG